MRNHVTVQRLRVAVLLVLVGCSGSSPNSSRPNEPSKPDGKKSAEKMAMPLAKPIVMDAGTVLEVTLDQSVSSKTNIDGDQFNASLARPIAAGDKVVLPVGTKVTGTVTLAHSAGAIQGKRGAGPGA
jgi:hypothetical protein